MAEKRLVDANAFWESVSTDYWEHFTQCHTTDQIDLMEMVEENLAEQPTVDAVEVPCRCCDCYYLLSGKNSFGLYFFCGHKNGLKNLRNTEKDFCLYAKKRETV